MRPRGSPPAVEGYAAFWLLYLRLHAHPGNRAWHYLGSALALACLAWAGWSAEPRWVLAAPVLGYGCAWIGHFAVEGNRPATFGHPLWSLVSDFRMFGCFLCGSLGRELERAAPPNQRASSASEPASKSSSG